MSAPVEAAPTAATAPARSRARVVVGHAVTALAGLLLLAIFLAPGHFRPLRIPIEALLGLALLLALPPRVRTVVAAVLGTVLGLWAVVLVVDVGFAAFLGRPFDPVLDWGYLDAGVAVVRASRGPATATGAVVAAIAAATALVVLVTLAVLRLSRTAARHRQPSVRVVAVLTVVWLVGAATGVPVAAHDLGDRIGSVTESLGDRDAFAAQLAVDAYRGTSADQLLTALRGRDVVVVLVESYGRVAIEQPEMAPVVTGMLTDGTDQLASAGFTSRSAFLTSSVFGGGSWLAFATLLSGIRVDNQQRYTDLAASDRLTLVGAFHRAGWRTVGIMPGVTSDWPEGGYYGFDDIRTSADLGYTGPAYAYHAVPDQYVLSYFQRTERSVPRQQPVMAVIPLSSSHVPWSPVPPLVDWDAAGDGSSFPVPAEEIVPAETVLQRDPARVRADYANAVAYSLSALVSYVLTYGDDDLVLLFLGDHQPQPAASGDTQNHDVPVSIVTRDPAVLDLAAGWGWTSGLLPHGDAPVWPMDSLRDRLLATFA